MVDSFDLLIVKSVPFNLLYASVACQFYMSSGIEKMSPDTIKSKSSFFCPSIFIFCTFLIFCALTLLCRIMFKINYLQAWSYHLRYVQNIQKFAIQILLGKNTKYV